ncbi:succinate--CoA ligase [ADP-forming] subunit beta, mitochondrial-like isoform X2 [Cucurbita maxima]|uniref:Succinate--CoA ligase [ADP-forming] subunit beta, mitochondrial-like isoform X2 n=1 Tax=Cucurbita maxima TaxID=3661 RepID=A0A6J1JUJ7_CUCMA|nr:succinate--CoA ligase [ADP-forming] subunit beta, mitochondrial-like isoform X2 [Cucurbita maxima]
MVRGLLNKIVSRSLSVAGKWQQQQLRRLNVHEYQGAELMKNMGSMCLRVLIFLLLMKQKTQFKLVFLMRKRILAGGRGLGTFKSGLKVEYT